MPEKGWPKIVYLGMGIFILFMTLLSLYNNDSTRNHIIQFLLKLLF